MTSKETRKNTLQRIDDLEKFKADCEGAIRIITDELAETKKRTEYHEELGNSLNVNQALILKWLKMPWWERVFVSMATINERMAVKDAAAVERGKAAIINARK